MPDQRSYVGGAQSLNLDGVKCGFLKSAAGGDATADVIGEPVGRGGFTAKHLGRVRYEPIRLAFDFNLAAELYDWIRASWSQSFERKDGSVVARDLQLNARSELRFTNALVTETGIPALDGAAKDPAYLTLVLEPESTRRLPAKGKATAAKGTAKQFIPSNFKLEIDGLDCTKVSKIDSFTVRRGHDGLLEVPNLTIALAEVAAESWIDWHEEFVVRGKNDAAQEKTGRITFLAPDRKAELGHIELRGLGIFALRHVPASGDTIPRVVAGLYCERMDLVVGKG